MFVIDLNRNPVAYFFYTTIGHLFLHNRLIREDGALSILKSFTPEEMERYREPFREPGESRRPTLTWPREIPIDGEPADVVALVDEYGRWLAAKDSLETSLLLAAATLTRASSKLSVTSCPNWNTLTHPFLRTNRVKSWLRC